MLVNKDVIFFFFLPRVMNPLSSSTLTQVKDPPPHTHTHTHTHSLVHGKPDNQEMAAEKDPQKG